MERDERVDRARAFFDDPRNYLAGARTDARVRGLERLVGPLAGARVLDAGCGDGSVSRGLARDNDLTWLDVSPSMLRAATEGLDPALRARVRCVEGTIDAFRPSAPFDLVLLVGVLAHVPSPDETLAHAAALLAPGGRLFIQFTDHDRLVPRLTDRWLERRREVYGYRLHRTTDAWITRAASRAGLRTEAELRYAKVPPVIRRLVGPSTRAAFEEATLGVSGLDRVCEEVLRVLRPIAG